MNICSLLGQFFYSQWNICWPWFLVFFNYLHTMINILCHRGNLLFSRRNQKYSFDHVFLKKSFNQTPHYCSLQFGRLNNLLLSIKILNHAMNHTKLNFGKIVHSIKETEKNCVVIKNTYLNNKTVKGIGLMQLFSVKRLCLILLNMYSLFLCIFLFASPLKQQW